MAAPAPRSTLAAASFEAGWLAIALPDSSLLLLIDPDVEDAWMWALRGPDWRGSPHGWLGQYIGDTPIGWEVHFFEREVPLHVVT